MIGTTTCSVSPWSKGVKLHGCSIGRFPRTGRGCVALRDLKSGDVVVEVPEDAIITAETSVAAAALEAFGLCGEALEEAESASPRLEREALVLAVMAEMSRGTSSDFAPYLAALPSLRATHSPLAWSGAELAELEVGIDPSRLERGGKPSHAWTHSRMGNHAIQTYIKQLPLALPVLNARMDSNCITDVFVGDLMKQLSYFLIQPCACRHPPEM